VSEPRPPYYLRAVAPTNEVGGAGVKGGGLVANRIDSKAVERAVAEGWRAIPSGSDHCIVRPPTGDSGSRGGRP